MTRTNIRRWLSLPLLGALFISSCDTQPHSEWRVYRGGPESISYSSLSQINAGNVGQLEVAWTYHTGDAGERTTIQCNPIVVDGSMYVTTPSLKLVALDPATGEEKWQFNPFADRSSTGVNRGVTYWRSGADRRIFFSAGPFLYAVNADKGTVVKEFGEGGKVDLRKGLGRDHEKLAVWATSPGVIYEDILIQGTALSEGYDAAPGFVRGFDVRTGATVWTFHTIPQPGEYGYDTWEKDAYKKAGGVNAWAGMSLDEELGTVFVPTGSAAFDFYGGNRKGQNLFANCLIALDARTGARRWHHQLVHHDLWDYDLPAPPALVTVHRDGKTIKAVAQVTKMGNVFLFDRISGEPVFPIEERPVPPSDLVEESAWPTQPFPTRPPPFVRQHFDEEEVTDLSDSSRRFILEKIKGARYGAIFTPPSTQGTIQFPGTRGGGEWGGPAFDPQSGMMYVNANEVPMFIRMKAVGGDGSADLKGENIYTFNNCSGCHGSDRTGVGAMPALTDIKSRLTPAQVITILESGKGQMPAFPNISEKDKAALVRFLMDDPGERSDRAVDPGDIRYVHDGWNILTDQAGYFGVKPPWGTLNAIDLNKGEIAWQVPLGEYPELTALGFPLTGTHNLGGPLVTAGGLLFIAATRDEKIRAFDKETGTRLWEYKLPAGGYATPATYEADGIQYVVIAAGGGGKVGTASGDAFVAFRLPVPK